MFVGRVWNVPKYCMLMEQIVIGSGKRGLVPLNSTRPWG